MNIVDHIKANVILDVANKKYANSRVLNWARTWRPQQPYAFMASPPTVSVAASGSSSIDGAKANGAATVSALDDRFDKQGSIWEQEVVSGVTIYRPKHFTAFGGVKGGAVVPLRARWSTDATAFELPLREINAVRFNLVIDDELAYSFNPWAFNLSGSWRYLKIDLGADVLTYGLNALGTSVAGTGYVQGEIITLDGGAGGAAGTKATVKVTSVSSGAVASTVVVTEGAYTTLPTGTMAQNATSGAGTGFVANGLQFQPNHTTKKMRNFELIYTDAMWFCGVVHDANSVLLPYRANPNIPKVCFVGDSISAGTHVRYLGGHLVSLVARRMGVWDKHIVSAVGGTGWNQTTNKWSAAHKIQDYVDVDADLYVFLGSQNDNAGAPLIAAVTSTLNALIAARPNAYIVGVGNVMGSSALCADIASGYAAADRQDRLRFINNQSPNPWIPSATQWQVTSDTAHLSENGQERFAQIMAEQVWAKVHEMVTMS